ARDGRRRLAEPPLPRAAVERAEGAVDGRVLARERAAGAVGLLPAQDQPPAADAIIGWLAENVAHRGWSGRSECKFGTTRCETRPSVLRLAYGVRRIPSPHGASIDAALLNIAHSEHAPCGAGIRRTTYAEIGACWRLA